MSNSILHVYPATDGTPNLLALRGAFTSTLSPAYEKARVEVSKVLASDRWTHVARMNANVDVRDDYESGVFGDKADVIALEPKAYATTYPPPATSTWTMYIVRFVELVGHNTSGAYKRVYLDRKKPTWPSNDI